MSFIYIKAELYTEYTIAKQSSLAHRQEKGIYNNIIILKTKYINNEV